MHFYNYFIAIVVIIIAIAIVISIIVVIISTIAETNEIVAKNAKTKTERQKQESTCCQDERF